MREGRNTFCVLQDEKAVAEISIKVEEKYCFRLSFSESKREKNILSHH